MQHQQRHRAIEHLFARGAAAEEFFYGGGTQVEARKGRGNEAQGPGREPVCTRKWPLTCTHC